MTDHIANADNMMRVELASEIDGRAALSVEGSAILLGVNPGELAAWWRSTGGHGRIGDIPAEWIQQGHRRSKEAMAHCGTSNIADALRYWIEREQPDGAVVEDPDAGKVWLITPRGEQ